MSVHSGTSTRCGGYRWIIVDSPRWSFGTTIWRRGAISFLWGGHVPVQIVFGELVASHMSDEITFEPVNVSITVELFDGWDLETVSANVRSAILEAPVDNESAFLAAIYTVPGVRTVNYA